MAGYTGPGSPPVTFHFRNPKRFEIYIGSAPGFNIGFGFFLQGRWLSARRGVLWGPVPRGGIRDCGWPTKTPTWELQPGQRVKVAKGTWTGTVAAMDIGSGSVSATVGSGGRTVGRFHLTYSSSARTSSNPAFAPSFRIAS